MPTPQPLPTASHPTRPLTRLGFVIGLGIGLGLAAALSPSPAQAQSESTSLYRLDTTCTLKGGAAQPCIVEAIDEGSFTTYRHTIGRTIETIRISDAPVRMGRFAGESEGWTYLTSAAVRLSTNTICFNGTDLCVINPNYLNSIREERPTATEGRDLMRVRFAEDGRVSLTCYDDGCEGVE